MSIEVEKARVCAAIYRKAIESVSSELGVGFEAFPLGACLDSCVLLGRYLIDQEVGIFNYVSGDYICLDTGELKSHAWLQLGNVVVDITADQFPDVSAPVIALAPSQWHQRLINQRVEYIGDYREYCDDGLVEEFDQMYWMIIDQL